jgi:hypothetical protein
MATADLTADAPDTDAFDTDTPDTPAPPRRDSSYWPSRSGSRRSTTPTTPGPARKKEGATWPRSWHEAAG